MQINIFYKGYREKIEIDVIGNQKQSAILGILWLAYHNFEINWITRGVKMMRFLEEYGKQWRPKQEKPRWQKQKKKEKKKKEKKQKKEKKKKNKPKKKRTMEVKKIAKEQEIRMRRKKQQNLKKRLKNWFFKGFTNRSMSLERK